MGSALSSAAESVTFSSLGKGSAGAYGGRLSPETHELEDLIEVKVGVAVDALDGGSEMLGSFFASDAQGAGQCPSRFSGHTVMMDKKMSYRQSQSSLRADSR